MVIEIDSGKIIIPIHTNDNEDEYIKCDSLK